MLHHARDQTMILFTSSLQYAEETDLVISFKNKVMPRHVTDHVLLTESSDDLFMFPIDKPNLKS